MKHVSTGFPASALGPWGPRDDLQESRKGRLVAKSCEVSTHVVAAIIQTRLQTEDSSLASPLRCPTLSCLIPAKSLGSTYAHVFRMSGELERL